MKRAWLTSIVFALFVASAAFAQSPPYKVYTTITSGSIAVTNTFQVLVASGVNSRMGCTVQNTATSTEYVYFGSTAPGSIAAAYQLAGGQSLNCATGSGQVAADEIWITGTAGATYVVGVQ